MNTSFTNLAALVAAKKSTTQESLSPESLPQPEKELSLDDLSKSSVQSQSPSTSLNQEPLTQHQLISAKIQELQSQLLANHPQMPLLLREIHSTLKNNPAVVTLLEEDEICTIFNGLQKQTNTYLVQSMTSTKSGKSKSLKNTSAADLGFD
jgi:hypothetical protein